VRTVREKPGFELCSTFDSTSAALLATAMCDLSGGSGHSMTPRMTKFSGGIESATPFSIVRSAISTPRDHDERSWRAIVQRHPEQGLPAGFLLVAPLEVRHELPRLAVDQPAVRCVARDLGYSERRARLYDPCREVRLGYSQSENWSCSAAAHDRGCRSPLVRNRVGGVYGLRGCRVPGLTRLVQGQESMARKACELRILPGPLGRLCACRRIPNSSPRGVVASRLRLDRSRCCLGRGFSVGSHVLAIHHGKEMSAVGLKNAVRGKR
jgi:hypothetical protein